MTSDSKRGSGHNPDPLVRSTQRRSVLVTGIWTAGEMPREHDCMLLPHERLDGVLFGYTRRGKVVPFGRIVNERIPFVGGELTPQMLEAANAELLRLALRKQSMAPTLVGSGHIATEPSDDELAAAEEAMLAAAMKVGVVST